MWGVGGGVRDTKGKPSKELKEMIGLKILSVSLFFFFNTIPFFNGIRRNKEWYKTWRKRDFNLILKREVSLCVESNQPPNEQCPARSSEPRAQGLEHHPQTERELERELNRRGLWGSDKSVYRDLSKQAFWRPFCILSSSSDSKAEATAIRNQLFTWNMILLPNNHEPSYSDIITAL